MKKVLSILVALYISVFCASAQGMMDIYGTLYQVDTIEYKQVGPGTMYCYAKLPALSQAIHVLTIDLENQYTEIETFLGKDCIAGTELVTSACNRHTQPGHDAYCGVNGDFFNVSANYEYPLGMPRGGSIQNGEVQVAPSNESWFWAYATMDVNKKPVMDYMKFEARVIIDETNTFLNTFNNCISLQNIIVDGIIGASIGFPHSPLTRESITNVIEHLSETATGKTVTFKKSAKEAAFTDDEWAELTATKPNWTFSLL